ncbi:MAG: hypothetical protein PVS3B2_06310 [Candidatus Dormibacteraceae bacterium]
MIVGAMLIVLTILGAMVFDVGLAMSDRRNLQAYSDSAALAGARSYKQGVNQAHWVAMQYLGASLNFTLPTSGCASAASCPAGMYSVAGFQITLTDSYRPGSILNYPTVLDVVIAHQQPSVFARMVGYSTVKTAASARATPPGPEMSGAAYAVAAMTGDALINGGGAAFQTVTGPVYAYGSFGANNVPHTTGVPSVQTNYNGSTCPGGPPNRLDNGGGSNSLNYQTTDGLPLANNLGVPPNYGFDAAVPTLAQPAPTYFSAAAAQDGLGNWKPGIYSGFAPSGGKMNGGVYKIINSTSLALGTITNTVHAPSGTSNGADAVAIIIDSSDTGALDITNATLNGLDDLNPPGYAGPRDPAGTHNFVIFGGHGPGAYTGGITIGPGASTDMSGIIYTPDSPYRSNGNSSPQFTGSLVVSTMTVNGGGNGAQVFHWVCGLNAVSGKAFQGGLVR